MSSAFAIAETETSKTAVPPPRGSLKSLRVQALSNDHRDEVLAFLSLRPIHTVFMAGLICDNGLTSFSNRGTFFGSRNRQGRLTGVALIGDKTVIEAADKSTFELFSQITPRNPNAHLIRGEQQQIEGLLRDYAAVDRTERRLSRELLLNQSAPLRGVDREPNLRLACSADLQAVVSTNASLAYEESGVNPLEKDPEGIWKRTAVRVNRGRVWVLVEQGRMLFKADVISETPQTVYIEGVYVPPEERRKGYALRCLTQLARNLLERVASICLVVNVENHSACALYEKAGYQFQSHYRTAYFSAI
jgi:uncharacterized protein